jgi:DeoR family suf operon transcriptional repressor
MSNAQPTPLQLRAADSAVVDLLRVKDALGVGDLATALGVTATAVRQRLDRLMKTGIVERAAVGGRRGRPSHAYTLTATGRRLGGDNFHDLALVLWREIRGVRDPQVRRGLLGRIGSGLAAMHKADVRGDSVVDRLRGVAGILGERDIACTVDVADRTGGPALPVLTSYACPYPDLAEEDRGICAAERLMIEELVGESVRLSECRLDGGACCRFTVGAAAEAGAEDPGADLQTRPSSHRMPSPILP